MATALSLATISGGSVANLWTYAQRYHPNPVIRRPLIDYDASLVFGPPLLAGTTVGSLLSVVFPEWLVVVLLVLLLGVSAVKTLSKGVKKWNKQTWQNLEDDGDDAGAEGNRADRDTRKFGVGCEAELTPSLSSIDNTMRVLTGGGDEAEEEERAKEALSKEEEGGGEEEGGAQMGDGKEENREAGEWCS
eukprot:CAMPEP_0171777328 /NCGR_PEP_ID=MMETSP0991-20121206/57724_1 /TAXON_ID=483369 /ORGANISM="non described non described, Strain CCMP2098" /LENGTH=189 /DNA_ID=CAMNT_0012384037 /DNA_START=400 /DNA_END=969 /DNA_ORIENTATION=-